MTIFSSFSTFFCFLIFEEEPIGFGKGSRTQPHCSPVAGSSSAGALNSYHWQTLVESVRPSRPYDLNGQTTCAAGS